MSLKHHLIWSIRKTVSVMILTAPSNKSMTWWHTLKMRPWKWATGCPWVKKGYTRMPFFGQGWGHFLTAGNCRQRPKSENSKWKFNSISFLPSKEKWILFYFSMLEDIYFSVRFGFICVLIVLFLCPVKRCHLGRWFSHHLSSV